MERRPTKGLMSLGVISLLALTFPNAADAYIDPGTGSYIFQTIIAIIVGASFTLKIYWKKIKTFLTSIFSRRNSNAQRHR